MCLHTAGHAHAVLPIEYLFGTQPLLTARDSSEQKKVPALMELLF